MQYELEIELKNLLTKDEFTRLKKFFSFQESDFILQTNFYFETRNEDFRKNKWNLRIREREGQFVLTLKLKDGEDVSEYHLPLTELETKEILTGKPSAKIQEILSVVQGQTLCPEWIGSLQTRRAECSYKDGIIFLDESTYFQQTDYEVEYEVSDRISGTTNFKKLLLQQNIPSRKTLSKIARFHTYKNQIKKDD